MTGTHDRRRREIVANKTITRVTVQRKKFGQGYSNPELQPLDRFALVVDALRSASKRSLADADSATAEEVNRQLDGLTSQARALLDDIWQQQMDQAQKVLDKEGRRRARVAGTEHGTGPAAADPQAA